MVSDLDVRLTGLEGAMQDLTPVYQKDVHQIFMDMEKRHFATEGAHAGVQFVPLNPGYAAWKAKQLEGSRPILQFTTRMYASLAFEGSSDHVVRVGPSFAEYGTRVPWARHHQFGTKKMPKRLVIPPLTKAEGERIVDAILIHVIKGLRGEKRSVRK